MMLRLQILCMITINHIWIGEWRLEIMSLFPSMVLVNKFYLGDTVLLQPIAEAINQVYNCEVYIVSRYPELLENQSIVKGLSFNDPNTPVSGKFIDMTDSLCKISNKVRSMYEACGLYDVAAKAPELYLRDHELRLVSNIQMYHPSPRIGLILYSRHKLKSYPYAKTLVNAIIKKYGKAYIFHDVVDSNVKSVLNQNTIPIIGQPLRTVMTWLKSMDLVIGVDTGTLHIAGALGVPLIVLTRPIWRDLYEYYEDCQIILSKYNTKFSLYEYPCRVKNVFSKIDEFLTPPEQHKLPIRKNTNKNDIALFRLDGIGGSITLTDHATKIYEMTGIKPVLIIRNGKDLFKGHPHIKDVIEVGYVKWAECLNEMFSRFNTIAEIRFAPGKWHQHGKKIFDQDFSEYEGIFNRFPLFYRNFEIHGMHHIQVTDKILGLPYNTIHSRLYNFESVEQYKLPKQYIVVSNGVDAQHQGMRQTKTWDYWDELPGLLDYPVVQVGTRFDKKIGGVHIDLRNKTSLGALTSVIRNAVGVICTEGGIMHMAYAVESPNVFVLRGPTRGKLFEYPGHHFIDSYICENCWSITDDWYMNCAKGADAACMKSISASRVAYNVEKVLNENMD